MARYMDVHHGFEGVTAEQLAEAHQADLDIEGAEGVHFESAWLDPELGKVFCLSTGPSYVKREQPDPAERRSRAKIMRPAAPSRPLPGTAPSWRC